jgi:hypothetical protein
MWDGKYITLSDEAPGHGEYAMYRATLSGTTLTEVGQTTLSGQCYSYSYDTGEPFIVGKRNTPPNSEQASTVIAPNVCTSTTIVSFWRYPKGGESYKNLATPFANGIAVSMKP